MKAFILILLASLSSFVGCVHAPSKSLLEERAGYGLSQAPPDMKLSGNGTKYVPTRVPEKVIVPWLHAKELPSKDYFWGAWISVVVAPETWEMKAVEPSSKKPNNPKSSQGRPRSKGSK